MTLDTLNQPSTKTRAQAEHEWLNGMNGQQMPTPDTDLGEAFRAGWTAHAEQPILTWVEDQLRRGRKLVALCSPQEASDGPRYAGYYCEDAPA